MSDNQTMRSKELALFIPVFNEEENLDDLFMDMRILSEKLLEREIRLKLFLIDNHSIDNSWSKIVQHLQDFPHSSAISLVRNIGYQQSLTLSFTLIEADALVVYQSDRQDPIEVIIEMCEAWRAGKKCVVGVATNRAENISERIGRFVFVKLFSSSSDFPNFRWFTDFYLLDRSLYKQFQFLPMENQFIRGRILEDFSIDSYISYNRKKRERGKSKFNFAKKYQLALDAILLHASRIIRRVTLISASMSALFILAFTTIIFLQIIVISNSNVKSQITSSFGLLLLSLLIFLLSIVLEYLRRIYSIFQSRKFEGFTHYRSLIREAQGEFSNLVGDTLKP